MVKAVIFDCFGVLVGRGFGHTYRTGGGDPDKDRDFINDMLGQADMGMISDDDFRHGMAAKLGITTDKWHQAVVEAEQPNHELLDYIKQLRPKYKTAILSNANHGTLERKLGDRLLRACFDATVTSADVGMVKPDPQIYLHTAELLGVKPPECVFIDDIEVLLAAARDLGMQTILYKDFAQLKAELEAVLAA